MKTPLTYIRRKTPLIMREEEGNITVKASCRVETKTGSRGWWSNTIEFPDSAAREQWIGEQLKDGARLVDGSYPLKP